MPVENPNLPPAEQPHDGWHEVAAHIQDVRDVTEHPDHRAGVDAFIDNHVNPQLHSKGLGHLAITTEERAGGRFLHKHGAADQKEVGHVISYLRSNGETISDKAGDRTAAYLKFMANTVKDGILTGGPESVRRQIDAHVIKANDVPESYFLLQQRIAREQGHGDVEITSDMKRQLIEAAQADQRGSLDKWVEYLGGDDGSYPDWFKHYAWDSVLKIGTYDKEKAKFDRRDEHTVAPYPELNREALAYAYDTVKKFHVLDGTVDDTKLKQILKEGSFGRLYAHAITEVTPDNPELRNNIEGSWTQFHQTTDPRTARRLSGSLQGHGTGWCTAGESTAEAQLNSGDFYVYYSRDEDSKDTIPRAAIRMQDGVVAEVRGVLPGQELEPAMAAIVSEQLRDLPGGEEYIKRAADMKHLTAIDNLLSKDPNAQLSAEDVIFLYELNRTIESFGYDDDPRVQELQLKAANTETAELLEETNPDAEITKRVRNHSRVHTLMDLARQEGVRYEFSDDDLCFIYGLNGPIQTLDPEDYEIAESIDYWQGGHDREKLIELMPAAFERQYQTSLRAYEATAVSLGVEVADTARLEREFSAKLEAWQEQGAYQYVLERLIEQDTQFTLVMTPNVPASKDQIIASAQRFGEQQPFRTNIFHELYDLYSGEELSGTQEQNVAVRFSLMPSKFTSEIGQGQAEELRTKLQQFKDSLPGLSIRVPSVLDAISYWQSLRARGEVLSGDGTQVTTGIRHIDLPSRQVGTRLGVPCSDLDNDGMPHLDNYNDWLFGGCRVLVG